MKRKDDACVERESSVASVMTELPVAPCPPKGPDPNVVMIPLLAGSVALSTIALPAIVPFYVPFDVANAGWWVAVLAFFSALFFLQPGRSVKMLGMIPVGVLLIVVNVQIQAIRKPSERLEAECGALQAQMRPGDPKAEAAAAIFTAYRCSPRL